MLPCATANLLLDRLWNANGKGIRLSEAIGFDFREPCVFEFVKLTARKLLAKIRFDFLRGSGALRGEGSAIPLPPNLDDGSEVASCEDLLELSRQSCTESESLQEADPAQADASQLFGGPDLDIRD